MIGRLLVGLAVLAATLQAAEAPALTELDRWRLLAVSRRVELAQREMREAQGEWDTLLRTLAKDGYSLDLGTLTYRPIEKP